MVTALRLWQGTQLPFGHECAQLAGLLDTLRSALRWGPVWWPDCHLQGDEKAAPREGQSQAGLEAVPGWGRGHGGTWPHLTWPHLACPHLACPHLGSRGLQSGPVETTQGQAGR